PRVVDLVPSPELRLFPVGRLDLNSEGLFILTNDGELANRLMHPRYGVEKEYLAEVEAAPTERQVARLRRGVELEDGVATAVAAPAVGPTGARADPGPGGPGSPGKASARRGPRPLRPGGRGAVPRRRSVRRAVPV